MESIVLPSPGFARLSRIETVWAMIIQAHDNDSVGAVPAQHEMLARYGNAILAYLRGAFRDEVAAEETYQEFAIRWLRGDYHKARPEKGRFRGFLKVVLSRLVADHYRKLSRRRESTLDEDFTCIDESQQGTRDAEFARVWRDQMLTMAWRQLAADEHRTSRPWMTVLRMRVEQPEARSVELAASLSDHLGETVTTTRLRVLLHRSRERFAQYLIDAVADSLDAPDIDEIEQELAELQLLQYCGAMIENRKAAMKVDRAD